MVTIFLATLVGCDVQGTLTYKNADIRWDYASLQEGEYWYSSSFDLALASFGIICRITTWLSLWPIFRFPVRYSVRSTFSWLYSYIYSRSFAVSPIFHTFSVLSNITFLRVIQLTHWFNTSNPIGTRWREFAATATGRCAQAVPGLKVVGQQLLFTRSRAVPCPVDDRFRTKVAMGNLSEG
jgi:hypothetical protein